MCYYAVGTTNVASEQYELLLEGVLKSSHTQLKPLVDTTILTNANTYKEDNILEIPWNEIPFKALAIMI